MRQQWESSLRRTNFYADFRCKRFAARIISYVLFRNGLSVDLQPRRQSLYRVPNGRPTYGASGPWNPRSMPLHWTIDSEVRFVSVIAQGNVSRLEVERLLDEMAAREAMTYRKLFDGLDGDTTMGPQDLLALGVRIRTHHSQGPIGALALVLPEEKAEIVVPVLGMLAAADRPMRIFSTRQKARRWLESLGGPLSLAAQG